MVNFELLRLNLEALANNLQRTKENRIEETNHNMDIDAFEKEYPVDSPSLPTYVPEDIEQGNSDLEMYENWLKN